MKARSGIIAAFIMVFSVGMVLATATDSSAHCDTLGGPVIGDARAALEKGDVTPVLKWVKKEEEGEVIDAFKRTLAVRAGGPQARELADMYFFETLVRLHRAGEGAPYTGLKPAGAVEPPVAEADRALEGGSTQRLQDMIGEAVAKGIRKRFARASEAAAHADDSVEAGREFVEAYVEFTHYVERLYLDARGRGHHE
jgi:hypothetical protein